MTRAQKAAHEQEVLTEFAAEACLQVDSGSILSRNPRSPTFSAGSPDSSTGNVCPEAHRL